MRGASLFAVFALAKILALGGRPLPRSAWSPLAYLWQDAAVALLFYLVFDRLMNREWPARLLYAALVIIAAINVPVLHVLSSPITVSMVRATGGALGDSFRYHATVSNVLAVVAVLLAGILLPAALRSLAARWGRRVGLSRNSLGWRAPVVLSAVVVATGPVAASRVDTRGLDRNSVVALARSALPRVAAAGSDLDFRAPLVVGTAPEDLRALRGRAAGRDVILVVLESTAARYLAPYGAAEDPMPYLTTLARNSLVFEDAYAVYPESIKGLVSTLASGYPAFDVAAEDHAALLSPSLATVLGGAGYESALFHSGRFMYLGMEEILGQAGFARLEDAGDIGGNRESSFGIDEESTVERILGWIDSLPAGRPFFATYLPIAGHHPYASAGNGPFPNAREIDRYRNALHDADVALRRLRDGLRARGREESTLVVVIGDHGEAFGQHDGNYAHTLALYDENVRVPFVISAPGLNGPQGRVARVASLVDVAPTILDLLGLLSPAAFVGSSLLSAPARAALFFTDYSLGLLGARDGCWKFIYELESSRALLFDVCRDPDERRDLSAQHSQLVAAFRTRLTAWAAAQVAHVRNGSPPD